MSRKVFVENYGCQMNTDDSLRMLHSLKNLDYQPVQTSEEADLILINTCSVREKASHKAHTAVGNYAALKREKPDLILGLTGCQAQVEGKKLLNRFHYLDFVLGPDQISQIAPLVENKLKGSRKRQDFTQRIKPKDFQFVSLNHHQEESLFSAFVTITKGCDNFCSFCIVPHVRGREVSRPAQEIIDEISALVDRGVLEVTLLGQNVNSYGTKGEGAVSFAELLYLIAKKTALKRLRFTTSHPKDVKEDLIAAYRDIPILCKHLHLPVQSGSDAVLKKMYRTYTRADYLKIVEQLTQTCPGIALTTDIIVGFPGESDEDFKQTLSLVREVNFDASFSFHYSPRPYTTAGRYFKDDVSLEKKSERLTCLQELQQDLSFKHRQACVGKEYSVLIESASKLGETFQGRSTHNRIVHLSVPDNLVGTEQNCQIIKATPQALLGILCE